MIEGVPIEGLATLAANFGLAAVVLVIWWVDHRAMARMMTDYQATINQVLAQYQRDMSEQREMYKKNAELVKRFIELTEDQKDLHLLLVQSNTRLVDLVEKNEWCPMVRVEKRPIGMVR